MTDAERLKDQLMNLVLSGRKEEAIKILQKNYGADRTEAERLLALAINENTTPIHFFSTVLKGAPERMTGGKGCKHTLYKYVAIMLGFIGLPPLLMAVGVYFYLTHQINESDIVVGTVIELRSYQDYGEPIDYTPIISYEIEGNEYSIEAPVYSSTPEFSVGQQVELFVHQDNPTDVIINTFTQRWFMIILIGSIGGFFTLSMIVLLYLSRASNKQLAQGHNR